MSAFDMRRHGKGNGNLKSKSRSLTGEPPHEHSHDETKIDHSELQILLNLFTKKVHISYPIYDFDFLVARIRNDRYDLEITCSEKDFDIQLQKFSGHSNELPKYSDLRGGLLSSGIMKYTNLDQFKERLKGYSTLKKEVKYSLDTNLLYFRFLSNLDLIKPSDMVLVKTVGNEIKAKLNYKYNPNQLNGLKKSVKYNKELLEELWNRRMKRSRKASYIALNEYKAILEGVADELDEYKDSSADSRGNDMIIVKTLAQLESEGHIFPILLTADDSMADLCNAETLEYFKFDLPHIINAKCCKPDQLIGLIFNLAVVFGFVKINSVIAFGEFRGKSSNRPNELKLLFFNSQLESDFKRDLRICRRLMELGIEK